MRLFRTCLDETFKTFRYGGTAYDWHAAFSGGDDDDLTSSATPRPVSPTSWRCRSQQQRPPLSPASSSQAVPRTTFISDPQTTAALPLAHLSSTPSIPVDAAAAGHKSLSSYLGELEYSEVVSQMLELSEAKQHMLRQALAVMPSPTAPPGFF